MLDRKEEHTAVGNRPNSVQRIRIGAARDGALTALHLESYGTGGTGTGAGVGGPARRMYLLLLPSRQAISPGEQVGGSARCSAQASSSELLPQSSLPSQTTDIGTQPGSQS